MENNFEAFVYKWKNLSNGKYYIGYHKGNTNDGYISSSKSDIFWQDFNNKDMIWERLILFTGNKSDCLKFEQDLLKEIDLKDNNVYNNARGSDIIFTEEVLIKMSISGKKRWENMDDQSKKIRNSKISKSKTGVPRSEETKKKMSDNLIGKSFVDRFGEERAIEICKSISEKQTGMKKPKQSLAMRGRYIGELNPMYGKKHTDEFKEDRRSYLIENNPGRNKTEETKRKISESKKGTISPFKGIKREEVECPHCLKKGGIGVMNRWHFDNCKYKENEELK